MTAAVSVSATNTSRLSAVTVSLTGFSATTAYTVKCIRPSGTGLVGVTPDGSGAASFVYTASEAGTTTVEVRPAAEHMGTTTAAATTTHVATRSV